MGQLTTSDREGKCGRGPRGPRLKEGETIITLKGKHRKDTLATKLQLDAKCVEAELDGKSVVLSIQWVTKRDAALQTVVQ